MIMLANLHTYLYKHYVFFTTGLRPMAGADLKSPGKQIADAVKNCFFIPALIIFTSFLLLFSLSAEAVEAAPSPEMVKKAIERGKAKHADIKKLFDSYTFGKLGVDVNGLVLTKMFEISQLAADSASQGKEPEAVKIEAILKKDYLLFAMTLIAADEKSFEPFNAVFRQALKILKPAEVIKDKAEKILCEKDVCVYKMDVYIGFYYSDFDPKRISVLALEYGSRKVEFAIQLDSYE